MLSTQQLDDIQFQARQERAQAFGLLFRKIKNIFSFSTSGGKTVDGGKTSGGKFGGKLGGKIDMGGKACA